MQPGQYFSPVGSKEIGFVDCHTVCRRNPFQSRVRLTNVLSINLKTENSGIFESFVCSQNKCTLPTRGLDSEIRTEAMIPL